MTGAVQEVHNTSCFQCHQYLDMEELIEVISLKGMENWFKSAIRRVHKRTMQRRLSTTALHS